jgi:hypothetical protein
MTITGTYGEERFVAICRLLPDDPDQAVHLAISVAAAACISAGVKDDKALSAFDHAIGFLRRSGVRKVVQ